MNIPIPLLIMSFVTIALTTAIIVLMRYALKREKAIRENGLFADSTVVQCTGKRDDGRYRYTTTVRYTGNDGLSHDAILSFAGQLPIGRKIRIQYLPGKYDYAIFISQKLEQGKTTTPKHLNEREVAL